MSNSFNEGTSATLSPRRENQSPAAVSTPPLGTAKPPRSSGGRADRPAPPSQHLGRRRELIAWIFGGAAIALVFSTFLPWASVLSVINLHISGGAVVYVLAFAAAYGAAGYLVYRDRVPRVFLIAAWVVNVWMIINIAVLFNALGNSQGAVSAGAGLYIACIGVIAGIVATVKLHRSGGATAPARTEGSSESPKVPGH